MSVVNRSRRRQKNADWNAAGTVQEILNKPIPLQGEKGDKGDKGDTGDQGIQGIQGIQGVQGLKGDKGDKGDTGDSDISGTPGKILRFITNNMAGDSTIEQVSGRTIISSYDDGLHDVILGGKTRFQDHLRKVNTSSGNYGSPYYETLIRYGHVNGWFAEIQGGNIYNSTLGTVLRFKINADDGSAKYPMWFDTSGYTRLGTNLYSDANIYAQNLSSGAYTPVFTYTNGSVTAYAEFHYFRIGDMVKVTGHLLANAIAGTSHYLKISLPIESNFTLIEDASGQSVTALRQSCPITAHVDDNVAYMQIDTSSTGNYRFIVDFTYKIK